MTVLSPGWSKERRKQRLKRLASVSAFVLLGVAVVVVLGAAAVYVVGQPGVAWETKVMLEGAILAIAACCLGAASV